MSHDPSKFFLVASAVRSAGLRRNVDTPDALRTAARHIGFSHVNLYSVHFGLHCRFALGELNVCYLLVAVSILTKRDIPSRCTAVFQTVLVA